MPEQVTPKTMLNDAFSLPSGTALPEQSRFPKIAFLSISKQPDLKTEPAARKRAEEGARQAAPDSAAYAAAANYQIRKLQIPD